MAENTAVPEPVSETPKTSVPADPTPPTPPDDPKTIATAADAGPPNQNQSTMASKLGKVTENSTDTLYTLRKIAACDNPDRKRNKELEVEVGWLKKELDEEKRKNQGNTELIKLLEKELEKMENEGDEIRNLLDEVLKKISPE